MTKNIAPIAWQEQSQQNDPLAPYTLDFGADGTWTFGLPAFYLQSAIQPAGVAVDLSVIDASVTITCGILNVTVPAYTRQNVQLPRGAISATFTASAAVSVPIAFYLQPPTESWQNYASAAAALANNNIFIGGTTGGTANAQSLNVTPAATWQFQNGVLIAGRAGFTNAGSTTIAINGGAAVAIYKTTDAGGRVPLSGGEIVAGSNFVLSANGGAGNYDLVSRSGLTNALAPINLVVFYASGTYTPSAGCVWTRRQVWGGGGGGGGNGTGGNNGGAGGTTSIVGSTTISASGGSGGQTSGAAAAAGSGVSGAILLTGGEGGRGGGNSNNAPGGNGGSAARGGPFGIQGPGATAGDSAPANSGAGGGGAGYFSGSALPAGGGGGGGYAEDVDVDPVVSTVTVGAGGAAGPAGSGGGAGGAGGSGLVIIEEYFSQVQ